MISEIKDAMQEGVASFLCPDYWTTYLIVYIIQHLYEN